MWRSHPVEARCAWHAIAKRVLSFHRPSGRGHYAAAWVVVAGRWSVGWQQEGGRLIAADGRAAAASEAVSHATIYLTITILAERGVYHTKSYMKEGHTIIFRSALGQGSLGRSTRKGFCSFPNSRHPRARDAGNISKNFILI